MSGLVPAATDHAQAELLDLDPGQRVYGLDLAGPAVALDELEDDGGQALARGPDRRTQGRGGLALARTGVDHDQARPAFHSPITFMIRSTFTWPSKRTVNPARCPL